MHCGEVILYYKDCVSVLLITAIGMHEVLYSDCIALCASVAVGGSSCQEVVLCCELKKLVVLLSWLYNEAVSFSGLISVLFCFFLR